MWLPYIRGDEAASREGEHPSDVSSEKATARRAQAGAEPGEAAGLRTGRDASQSSSTSVIWLAPPPFYKTAGVDCFILAGQKRKLKFQRISKLTKISYLSEREVGSSPGLGPAGHLLLA